MPTNIALLTGGQGINNVQSTGDQFRYQGMDPDDALEQQALNRRQQIANMLIQQGLSGSGSGQMVGRFYVPPSPVQGIADLAKVGVGAYGTYKNDEARGDLASKNQQILAEAVAKWKKDSADREVTTELEGPGAPTGQPQPTQPPQESATDTLSRLLPPPGSQPSDQGTGPQAIPNDGRSPTGFTQNFNPNTGGPLTPPTTPPIPSWANMSEMSGQAMSAPPQGQGPPPAVGVTEGPRPTRTTTTPRTSEEKRQAIIERLVLSRNPQAQRVGQVLLSELDKTQAREDQQAYQKGESALNREARSADAKLQLDAMVANKLITQEQANNLLAQNQKLHDERMGTEKERDRKNALTVKEMEVEARKDGKVPPGYRTTADGNLEAVPGGPADTKLQGVLNLDTSMLQNSNASFDRLAESANQILNHPGIAGITGVRGAIPDVPGTQAADARALLNKLKSQVGFGVLQEMRNNSKSGGALGSVSDAEGKRLENNLASVESAQSIDQMKRELQGIVDYATGAKDRLREAFNMKHKQGEPPAAMQPKGMTPSVPSFHDPEKQKRYDKWKQEHRP